MNSTQGIQNGKRWKDGGKQAQNTYMHISNSQRINKTIFCRFKRNAVALVVLAREGSGEVNNGNFSGQDAHWTLAELLYNHLCPVGKGYEE